MSSNRKFQVMVTIYRDENNSDKNAIILLNKKHDNMSIRDYLTSFFPLKHKVNHVLLALTFRERKIADAFAQRIIEANPTLNMRAKSVITA